MTSLNTTKGGTLWLVRLGRVPEEGDARTCIEEGGCRTCIEEVPEEGGCQSMLELCIRVCFNFFIFFGFKRKIKYHKESSE